MKKCLNVFFMIFMGVFLFMTVTDSMAQQPPRPAPPGGPPRPGEEMGRPPEPRERREPREEAGRPRPPERPGPREEVGRPPRPRAPRPFNIFNRARTLLHPNGPVILGFELFPTVFFAEKFRGKVPFLFLPPQTEPQTLEELVVWVTDPDGPENIDRVRIDLLLPPHLGGFTPRALVLTKEMIVERDEAEKTVGFGMKDLKLRGDLPPMVFVFIANAIDKEGHKSNMGLAAATIAKERTEEPGEADVLFPFGEPTETPEGKIIAPGEEEEEEVTPPKPSEEKPPTTTPPSPPPPTTTTAPPRS